MDDDVALEPNEITRLIVYFVSDGNVEEGEPSELVIVDDDELGECYNYLRFALSKCLV